MYIQISVFLFPLKIGKQENEVEAESGEVRQLCEITGKRRQVKINV